MRSHGFNAIKCFFGSCAMLALGLGAYGQEIDVVSYRIDATIESDHLTETVTLEAIAKGAARKLELKLAGSVELLSCRLGEQDVPFEHTGSDLVLDLESASAPKGEFSLVFELKGSPYNNQRGKFIRTVISEKNAYIRSQYDWYPRKEDDEALFVTRITLRKDWMVRTAGSLQDVSDSGERRTWTFVVDEPCRDIGLAAGAYELVERKTGSGLELDALVLEEHVAAAEILLDTASEAIEFYSTLLQPLSEGRYSLVEMPAAFGAGSGYGEVGYALIGSGAFESAEVAPWAASLVAHEVSHTWWGSEVRFSDFASEMLATYTTLRYLEASGGEEAARVQRQRFVNRIVKAATQSDLVALDTIEGWGGNTDPAVYAVCAYDKAAMLMHMLEEKMGRKSFDKVLRKLFEKNQGQTVAYRDVKKSLGGSRHKSLFSQWEAPDIPELSEEHEVKATGASFAVKGALRQTGTPKPLELSVTLRAIADGQTYDKVVQLKKAEASFKFSCPFEPDQIVIDPDFHLVRDLAGLVDIDALTDAIFKVANSPGNGDPAQLKSTIQKIRRVIAAGPKDESVYHTAFGRCLFRLGELDEARAEFETALKGGAGGPFHRAWIHLRLGCISDLEGDRPTAVKFYEKALAADARYETQRKMAERFLKSAYRGHSKDG